jgi:hypothetical protein
MEKECSEEWEIKKENKKKRKDYQDVKEEIWESK